METEELLPPVQKNNSVPEQHCLIVVFFNWIFTKLQTNVRKSLTFSFVCCPATSVPWGTGAALGFSEYHNVSSTCLDFTVSSGRSSFSSFSSSLKVGGAWAGFTFSCKIRRMLVTQNWWLYIQSVCCCGIAESQSAYCRGLGHWQHAWLLLFSSHGTFWFVTFHLQYYKFLNLKSVRKHMYMNPCYRYSSINPLHLILSVPKHSQTGST